MGARFRSLAMAVIESALDTDPVKPMREMNSAWLASPQERRTTFLAQRDRRLTVQVLCCGGAGSMGEPHSIGRDAIQ